MTGPESFPVEDARKKFADILDGTQFRSTHTQITRRGKPAGYVVPPEWYASAAEALTEVNELRRKLEELSVTPPPARSAAPRPAAWESQTPHPKPEPQVEERPLTDEEAAEHAALARSRADELQLKRLEQDTSGRPDGLRDFIIISSAMSMGLLTHDEVYGTATPERPVGGEETTT